MSTTARKLLLLLFVVLIAAAAAWYWQQRSAGIISDDRQIKSPHFLDSTPLHGEVYAAQPINVTLNFDFDLSRGSGISVTSEGSRQWQEGDAQIEDGGTALKISLQQGMPDGRYSVQYTACWPDKSCHEGRFFFVIDSSRQADYEDMRGQDRVSVSMKDLAFKSRNIMVSRGTTIVWVNDDPVGHFVNSETHPEHTYFLEQNSREIAPGERFSTTFEVPGQYSYHCSAHVPEGMHGSIIVL